MRKFDKYVAILGLILVILGFGAWLFLRIAVPKQPENAVVSQTQNQKQANSLFYKGKEGIDALTLLKKQAEVFQDASGLVVSINNRKADSAKHEYWAFYINGKLASVGPGEYKTKEADKVEWKIQKY